ncbi:hypothetical protein StoSoilA2_33930 [Arthrobacter sp. StoSoilA2]|uniref:hypothetical protein n=1 Tax=Arthrobacter sp. StoSoilA2 TaxID=2830990 RepID=UPI001CC6EC2A|nr:hypothetical protein [Arthrobacter sp. StoSoilA2]BCW37337.1 hypothetical protein StoSoilA2_33930 [Arthrobacter sp. StoSoilA2]
MAKFRSETSLPPTVNARHIVASLLAAFVLVVGFLHTSPAQAAAPPVYPISGFFIFGSSSDTVNLEKLSAIKAVGGDTVVTFGSRIKPATLTDIPADCKVNGTNCAQAAAAGVKVNRYFTYSDNALWGTPSHVCPRDISLTGNGKPFTVFVLPNQGSSCTSSNGLYDVVVVSGATASGTAGVNVSVAKTATSLGMKYYAGLPIPVARTDYGYLPDVTYLPAFTQFTDRFLRYQRNVINVAGLGGFYLSYEMPVTSGTTFDPILNLYRIQNQAIARIHPERGGLVSPYLDGRKTGGLTTTQVRDGAEKIGMTAGSNSLVIAIQDGMGTGKSGAFFGNEASSPVDPYNASIVGSGTWGSKYQAPVRDYFAAAAEGIDGTGAQLWANLEGMAPATSQNPCDSNLRGQTTKSRVDRQLQQLGNSPMKVISFMWDGYYTCTGTWSPLAERIKAGNMTPVITDSIFYGNGDVLVTGHNLSGGTVTVKWTDVYGRTYEKTVTAANYNPDYGEQRGINPRLESVTAKLGSTSLGIGKYYMIDVVNGAGAKNDAFYSDRG